MASINDFKIRARHEQWLKDITAIPTAAGREQRIIAWVKAWARQRGNLELSTDKAGNLFISQVAKSGKKPGKKAKKKEKRRPRPLFITAHLDHPGFVVRHVANDDTIELEFRGGVSDPYFQGAHIDIFDAAGVAHRAAVLSLDPGAKPFKRVIAQLTAPTAKLAPGDVGRWAFEDDGPLPRIEDGILHTPACDDLAAVAAALAALDVLRATRGCEHVGVMLTRAEEVGFIGAIAACRLKSVSKKARLICLENSRSFAESPIGGGPIMRVGDKMSVFNPALTNQISALMMEHQKAHPEFKWQRKLMPGGTCEATTFSTFGYESTCICLPLGNYHNMRDIDGVNAGQRPAKVGPEHISVEDYHGMIRMLVICATELDSAKLPSLRDRMHGLLKEFGHVLEA